METKRGRLARPMALLCVPPRSGSPTSGKLWDILENPLIGTMQFLLQIRY